MICPDISTGSDSTDRRMAASMLGYSPPWIPAVISTMGTQEQNLVQMFNIHLVREPWQDMPTAWALEKVIAVSGREISLRIAPNLEDAVLLILLGQKAFRRNDAVSGADSHLNAWGSALSNDAAPPRGTMWNL